MVQRAEIIVEEFEQGITVRWFDADKVVDPSKSIAIKGYEDKAIGKEIWEDVSDILHESLSDKVRIKIEYEVI